MLCLLATALPAVRLAHGFFRTLEFPRSQLATLSLIAAIGCGLTLTGWPQVVFTLMSVVALGVQLFHIIRFTPLWSKQSPDAPVLSEGAPSWTVSILACNVKESNREFDRMKARITEADADLVLLMETTPDWVEAMRPALEAYKYRVERPQTNGYGMMFASREEPLECEVRHLLNEEVPSIHLTLAGPKGGPDVRVIMLHPEPPIPADNTYGRDAEIAKVAEIAREIDSPIIVTGDLNDVAWSLTTRRFLRISKLLDPRQGRGMFNSFDARYPFLRWPLDHIFHSAHFSVLKLKRLKHVGSDHFPMFFAFALTDPGAVDEDEARPEDLEEADELISIEKKRDSRPHGVDWEI
ncbi:endonuclease/exonuclease/phosphatase family protein [Pseudohoeflea coraliihabitans]|uniref:Endonuclease/exonuclease/phosphatase family protein n=1 Tax=Pseudohoeflea coraliihabitans TaxID=2860393 RepID=A0ABS6WMQ1_9HYPH|nr:endonuclease/exonuclease/phosphatase family protein [Pseudohoeflea sp. DP4N28-3]MBW3097055.1 endonuclease/exonuclease/phosphatase family protein [Pseudohoeflea sp. DP4N28-3]